MTEASLRTKVSYGLVFAHFIAIITVIIMWIRHGFTFSEMTTSIWLLVPMFATYTTTIIAYAAKNRHAETETVSNQLRGEFTVFAILLTGLCAVLPTVFVVLKAYNYAFEILINSKSFLEYVRRALGHI